MSGRIAHGLFVAACSLAAAGCVVDGIDPRAARELHWLGFHDHTDIATDTRWRLAADSRITLEESGVAADARWIDAARAGVGRVVAPVDPTDGDRGDYLLFVTWPSAAALPDAAPSGWRFLWPGNWLPPASDPVAVRVRLVDIWLASTVHTGTIKVDPHWFSRSGARPDQIEAAFTRYASQLIASP